MKIEMMPTVTANELNEALFQEYQRKFDVSDIFCLNETPGTYVRIGFNRKLIDAERNLVQENGHFLELHLVRMFLDKIYYPFYDYCLIKVED